MNKFLSILKAIGKGGAKVADVGGNLGVPVLKQVDSIADAVKSIKGRRKVDTENIGEILAQLDGVKFEIKRIAPGSIEHKRLKAAIVNVIAVIIIYAGFDPMVADQVALFVTGPILAFIAGDTMRPSGK